MTYEVNFKAHTGNMFYSKDIKNTTDTLSIKHRINIGHRINTLSILDTLSIISM